MKITQERINQIGSDRNLHMLIGHTAILAAALKDAQEEIEKIKNHLGLDDTGDASKKSD
jgi:hypothetical protein